MTTHDDLVIAFDQWVLDPHRGRDLEVAVHLRRGVASDRWPVVEVLYELADVARPVDERVRVALQLPVAATYAVAARLLWATRHVWETVGAEPVPSH